MINPYYLMSSNTLKRLLEGKRKMCRDLEKEIEQIQNALEIKSPHRGRSRESCSKENIDSSIIT